MIDQVMFSSSLDSWCTPERVLDLVRKIGPIGLDPCTNSQSIVRAAVEWSLSLSGDSLSRPWSGMGLVFVNPPYGRAIADWCRKIHREHAENGTEVVSLVPSRTDTKWWDTLLCASAAVCFVRGRLTFLGAPHPAPFPSAVVYHGDRTSLFRLAFGEAGRVFVTRQPLGEGLLESGGLHDQGARRG